MHRFTPPPRHDHQELLFPKDFLWGAATSAYQVEGGNTNSDWWEWEEKIQPPDKRSGAACDQYRRYEKDFELAKELGHNAHRLSIEWSRIEPVQGEFDQSAIDHYKHELKTLKDLGLRVFLTLHHFTSPLWFSKLGGWKNSRSPKLFEQFISRIVPELGSEVDFWITINEPTVYAFMGYSVGVWPPQKKNRLGTFKVIWNMAKAHKRAYRAIHRLVPNAQVGIAHNVSSFELSHKHSILELISIFGADIFNNHFFYLLTGKKTHDFLGLNYYFNRHITHTQGSHLPQFIDVAKTHRDVTDMGWEIYPEGIYNVLVDLADYQKPIYITENGLASINDDRRCRFLISYLKAIYEAIQTGVNVRGYLHWSLLDNFEWADGFEPRFGLIEVDFMTQKRTPRPSSFVYEDIIKNNGIKHYLLKFLGHSVNAEEVLSVPATTGSGNFKAL